MTTAPARVDVEALRQQHPIAEVVAGYGITLRPAGQSLVGRCPFHPDGGRPNFHVYPESRRWYCFRCAIGGDAIDFVRRQEGVGFAEACRRLARLTPRLPGLPAPNGMPRKPQRWDRRGLEEQVVLNRTCALYQKALWNEPGALRYLRERGIPDGVIRDCGLGYADGHRLEAELRRRNELRLGHALGLFHTPSYADAAQPPREFFAGRIVVPELRGSQCCWLIGRSLDDKPERPKYLALPGERPVLGFERASGQREVFLCEGVFDYLTAVSWQLPACSPCGTALPAERLGFLARAEVVYGVLDGDPAGRAAAERFGRQLGERWQPLRLPDGCDLNDLGRRPDGRAHFFHLLAEARRARGKERGDGR